MGGWQGLYPKNFHTFVVNHSSQDPEGVYNSFAKNKGQNYMEKFGVEKEKVIDYITLI